VVLFGKDVPSSDRFDRAKDENARPHYDRQASVSTTPSRNLLYSTGLFTRIHPWPEPLNRCEAGYAGTADPGRGREMIRNIATRCTLERSNKDAKTENPTI